MNDTMINLPYSGVHIHVSISIFISTPHTVVIIQVVLGLILQQYFVIFGLKQIIIEGPI